MELINTGFDGLYIIQHQIFNDVRGVFVKTYNQTIFDNLGIELKVKERYYSISNKNVIRGMHFQTPPYDHIKLVTVIKGTILDVVVDLRQNSSTYGKFFHIQIGEKEGKTILIPSGFAHGFRALENDTVVEYNQTTEYAPDNDAGIRYDSFGFDWGISEPVMSARDLSFEDFLTYNSPFK